jgi:dTDP-4-amino-4,6-dideoxygalactose transaminase
LVTGSDLSDYETGGGKMSGPGSRWIGREEFEEIREVMESGYLFRYGSLDDPDFQHKVYSFEREFAARIGVRHALATSSGTGALFCALKALGIGAEDEVIVPAYTFIATYSAIMFAGGVPVLANIDESLNIDPEDIEHRITKRTKAIMPVHMLGNPADLEPIRELALRSGLPLIEDVCQANGGSYRGRRLGSIGEVGTFSLNIFKTVTAGDGGVVATDDEEIYRRAFGFHDQGHSPLRSGVEVGRRSELGMNFRMNELTGAVALAQLKKLDPIIEVLQAKKRLFKESIGDIEGMSFRRLNDPKGDCGTLCTVIFDRRERAARVSRKLGTVKGRPCWKGAYPRTDDILSRAINLSVGVVDPGLGAGFGLHIDSSQEEIFRVAAEFRNACRD